MFILVYEDDIIIIKSYTTKIQILIGQPNANFSHKDLGIYITS